MHPPRRVSRDWRWSIEPRQLYGIVYDTVQSFQFHALKTRPWNPDNAYSTSYRRFRRVDFTGSLALLKVLQISSSLDRVMGLCGYYQNVNCDPVSSYSMSLNGSRHWWLRSPSLVFSRTYTDDSITIWKVFERVMHSSIYLVACDEACDDALTLVYGL